MINCFYYSRRWFDWAYGGGSILVLSLWVQVQLTVAINTWYGGFYDLLQNADKYSDVPESGISLFYDKLISIKYFTQSGVEPSFLVIAMPYVILATFTGWFTRIYGLRWRESITFDYIPRWRNVEVEIEGASQRIQEDCNRFARIVEGLGLQAVRAIMTLIAFLPVLWTLSESVDIPILRDYEGSLVWTALLVSIGGLIISWFVGIKLPGLEYNNQKVEAAFRKDLVLGEDDKVNYAQPERLYELFLGIRFNYQRLYLHYGYFDVWQNSYGQFMVVVPYLIVGPGLFTGAIMLGTVVQVSNAFQRVHGSFDLFLQNWTTITELRSIIKRLSEFERNLSIHNKAVSA
jgi:peptide/bleomycin uptake transporter